MHHRRDGDGEPRGARVALARPSALAVAAGAATVLPGFLVGALVLQIRGDVDAGVEAVALGVTVFFLAGALGAGPGGRLAERFGAARAMRGCVLVTAACLLSAAALADSLVLLLALLAVAGLANAVCQPATNLFMAEQVPLERQGLAFGIKQSAIPAAILVSGLALPLLALPLGWRTTFAVCALGPLAVAVALGRSARHLLPPAERVPAPRPSRGLVAIAAGAALASAGPNAMGAYLVASAVHVGIAEGAAGLLAALGSALSLVVRVAAGGRADRIRRREQPARPAASGSISGYCGVVALLLGGVAGFLLLATGLPAPFVIGALVGYALGWGWPGLFNLAVVQSHPDAPGAATGVSQTGIYVGAAGGPAAFGAISAAAGYDIAWAATAILALAAALVIGLAARRPATGRAAATAGQVKSP